MKWFQLMPLLFGLGSLVGCKTTSSTSSVQQGASLESTAPVGASGRQVLSDEQLARKIYDFAREKLESFGEETTATHLDDFERFKFEVVSRNQETMRVEFTGTYRKTADLYENPEGDFSCYTFQAGVELVGNGSSWEIPREREVGVASENLIECL